MAAKRRRPNGSKVVKVYNPAHLMLANGKRRNAMAKKTGPKRRRPNSATAIKTRRRTRRRNPAIKPLIMAGIAAAGGSVATQFLTRAIPANQGPGVTLLIKGGIALGVTWGGGQVFPQHQVAIAAGAFSGVVLDAVDLMMGYLPSVMQAPSQPVTVAKSAQPGEPAAVAVKVPEGIGAAYDYGVADIYEGSLDDVYGCAA